MIRWVTPYPARLVNWYTRWRALMIIVLHFCHYIHLIHSTVIVGRILHKISRNGLSLSSLTPIPKSGHGVWALLDGLHNCSSHVSSRVLALLECKDSHGRGICSGLAGQGRDGDWEHWGFWGRSYNTLQAYLGAISPSGVPLLSMWGISSVMKPILSQLFMHVVLVECCYTMLRFNLMRVEIRELRPEVVTEDDDVLVHYRSRTNVWRELSSKTLA